MKWLANTRTALLDTHEIDLRDRAYCIPSFADLAPLVKSIDNVGILNQPLLQEQVGGKMVPVLGRRRLQAALQLGISRTEVRIISDRMSEAEGFVLALWDNLGHRTFDTASTAVVVRRLLDLMPREVVADDFLPLLRVPARGPRLERLRAIGGLGEPVLQSLALGRIQEKTAFILSALSSDEQGALLGLTDALGMNANKRAEVIGHLCDLATFHGKPVLEFLREEEARSVIHDEDIPVPERAARFRRLVRSWKFPELVNSEQEFQEWLRCLPESDRIVVRAAPGFESRECTIEIRTESREEAERIVNRLKEG
ncbi:MAG: ParB N-terminal domain-containing protein [Desulfomonilaceae bacterium]